MSKIRILAFIDGASPTPEQKKFAEDGALHGVTISFRNRKFVQDDHKPEACDGVTAFDDELPAIYKDHPGITDVMRKHMEEIERRRALAGDEPAPNATPPAAPLDPAKVEGASGSKKPAQGAAGWSKNQ